MLRGWPAQQAARGLTERTITRRERLVRGFLECTDEFPWNWTPAHVDEWSLSLTSEKHLAPSTIRNYQMELRLFSEFLVDGRYGWAVACEEAFGTHPVPICHEWNTRLHLSQYEGRPEARPFTREELQRFFDYADDQVERAVAAKRKGALAAYRDATVFKVIYAWGLFSGVRLLRDSFVSRVCAAQKLLNERLSAAAGVVQGPARRVIGAGWCG